LKQNGYYFKGGPLLSIFFKLTRKIFQISLESGRKGNILERGTAPKRGESGGRGG
jgi:hypothetical protein